MKQHQTLHLPGLTFILCRLHNETGKALQLRLQGVLHKHIFNLRKTLCCTQLLSCADICKMCDSRSEKPPCH